MPQKERFYSLNGGKSPDSQQCKEQYSCAPLAGEAPSGAHLRRLRMPDETQGIGFLSMQMQAGLLTWHHTHRERLAHEEAIVRKTRFILEAEPAEIGLGFDAEHELTYRFGLVQRVGLCPVLEQLLDREQLLAPCLVDAQEAVVEILE